MKISLDGAEFTMENLVEQCIANGNRDIRSQLIIMPCKPRFPRQIPLYLDNTASTGTSMDQVDSDVVEETDLLNISSVTQALVTAGNIEIKDIISDLV